MFEISNTIGRVLFFLLSVWSGGSAGHMDCRDRGVPVGTLNCHSGSAPVQRALREGLGLRQLLKRSGRSGV